LWGKQKKKLPAGEPFPGAVLVPPSFGGDGRIAHRETTKKKTCLQTKKKTCIPTDFFSPKAWILFNRAGNAFPGLPKKCRAPAKKENQKGPGFWEKKKHFFFNQKKKKKKKKNGSNSKVFTMASGGSGGGGHRNPVGKKKGNSYQKGGGPWCSKMGGGYQRTKRANFQLKRFSQKGKMVAPFQKKGAGGKPIHFFFLRFGELTKKEWGGS